MRRRRTTAPENEFSEEAVDHTGEAVAGGSTS